MAKESKLGIGYILLMLLVTLFLIIDIMGKDNKELINDEPSVQLEEDSTINMKKGFNYPKQILNNPMIIFMPNDTILREFPKKVVYGIYCALTEGLGTEPYDLFVSSWDKDEYGLYTVSLGFNSGENIELQIDAASGAYKYDKTMNEAKKDSNLTKARGDDIFTYPQDTVNKFIEIVRNYSGIENPELTTLKERNCCWVIWYNDANIDRFFKLDKETEELMQRGHYDALKEEYVVDWEREE